MKIKKKINQTLDKIGLALRITHIYTQNSIINLFINKFKRAFDKIDKIVLKFHKNVLLFFPLPLLHTRTDKTDICKNLCTAIEHT